MLGYGLFRGLGFQVSRASGLAFSELWDEGPRC